MVHSFSVPATLIKLSIGSIYLLVLKVLTVGHIEAQSGWFAQNSGTAFHLYGVHFVDSAFGTAVGEAGIILRTSNGGATWEQQSSGTGSRLLGVHFVNRNNGLAVGESGIILHTTDGGSTWISQPSGRSRDLYGAFLTSLLTGIAVGSPDPTPNPNTLIAGKQDAGRLRLESTQPSVFSSTLLRTSDGGTTWTNQWNEIPIGLYGVSFPDSNKGFAVGAGELILTTIDGGVNWNIQHLPPVGGILYGVSFADSFTGTAVGGTTILHTTNGGGAWTNQQGGTSQNLFGVSFADTHTGFAVGSDGTILRTTDGGTSWLPQSSGTTVALNAISFSNANTGTVVGMFGTILRTTSGGVVSVSQEADPSRLSPFLLEQNYPNPFNPTTSIRYVVPERAHIDINLYDCLGRLVQQVLDESQTPGTYNIELNADNLGTGVYYYRLSADGRIIATRKLMVVR